MADIPGADAVKAPIGWAKAKPLAFVLLVIVVALLTLRFAAKISAWVNRYRIGRFLTGGVASTAPTAAVLFALLSSGGGIPGLRPPPAPPALRSPPAIQAFYRCEPRQRPPVYCDTLAGRPGAGKAA